MSDNKIWTVSEVNAAIRDIIEGSLMPVWVSAETGNLTIHRSGHVYMTLKDRDSQLRAVYFNGAAVCKKLNLREGSKVEVLGKLGVYTARGEYQLNVRMLQAAGLGDLQLRFEELKQKLAIKGYFDEARKKPLPFLPARIGIISSPSGAALKDFLKIALTRFPGLHIKVFPAPVQGKGAERKLAEGIRFFNRAKDVDVIILTRGGGSLEDLWAFNEELLAEAIFKSHIPVVSAVGHEIDFTIADFTADFRAPTPSGAAEALIPQQATLYDTLEHLRKQISTAADLACERAQGRLDRIRSSNVMRQSTYMIMERAQTVDMLMRDAERTLTKSFESSQGNLKNITTQLNAYNPYNVLKRGYALLLDQETSKPVTSVADAPQGKRLTAVLADGRIGVVSEGTEKE